MKPSGPRSITSPLNSSIDVLTWPPPMKGLNSRSSKNTCTEPPLLVGVVAADHPFAGERIVGRADARQQQQPHVAKAIGAQNHDAGRLLDLVAAWVDVGHAGGLPAGGIRVDAQHVA